VALSLEKTTTTTHQAAVLEFLELVEVHVLLVREQQRIEAEVPCALLARTTRS